MSSNFSPSYNRKKQTSASENLVVKLSWETEIHWHGSKNIFAKGKTTCLTHLFMPEATEYNKWETN